jgi:hypothetical protein
MVPAESNLSVAVTEDGELLAWGAGEHGHLGLGAAAEGQRTALAADSGSVSCRARVRGNSTCGRAPRTRPRPHPTADRRGGVSPCCTSRSRRAGGPEHFANQRIRLAGPSRWPFWRTPEESRPVRGSARCP